MKQARKLLSEEQAFTLIELLVAMAILAIVVVGLFAMLSSMLTVRENNNVDQALNSEGNHMMNRIEFLIRNGITMPNICCPDGITCRNNSGNSITTITEENVGGQRVYRSNTIRSYGVLSIRDVGADHNSAVEAPLLSDGIGISNLNFDCEILNVNLPNQSARMRVSFTLFLERDTLGQEFLLVEEDFERTIVIANSHVFMQN
ncbi:MAG: prepilin-type N-terminal cleavage/methylation domain-containing protein [Pseudomonadales bacterium]|jgi:prepilin-type N-terminal cleavage/methylation domain-containing protein|nr:prepilin-type N-terminal cleavage/methylation domain-containing protein [Pseudomonadales bacterium]